MRPSRSPLCGLYLCLALPCLALEWRTQVLHFTTAPFQITQEALFPFTNNSAKPVTIVSVESNCDCLVAAADGRVYAPGAAGFIRSSFTIGDRLGLYERRLKVVTDESPEPTHLLVRIEVPELVTLTPRSVAWEINEPVGEKTIDLEVIPGLKIEFTRVEAPGGDFSARLETVEPGRRYRLYLKPPGTARPANAAFRVQGQAESKQTVLASAYGNVR